MPELFVGQAADFVENDRKVVSKDSLEIGVFQLDGSFYAYENQCPHRGGPVCQGKILSKVEEVLGEDKTSRGLRFSDQRVHIVCPWHGYEYDIRTGVHAGHQGLRLKKFETNLRDGGVYVVI